MFPACVSARMAENQRFSLIFSLLDGNLNYLTRKQTIMRKTCWILLFLCIGFSAYAQEYDLIVTNKGDSIACRIDSITDAAIYFEMKYNNNWIHTNINMDEVFEYESDAINGRLFVFREGTTYIESFRQGPASFYDLPRNSLYFGILTINYARLFPQENVGITLAAGLSDIDVFGVVVESTLLMGGMKHFFEPGMMVALSPDYGFLMLRTGYRFQGSQGLLLRVSPMFVFEPSEGNLYIVPAASLGFSF